MAVHNEIEFEKEIAEYLAARGWRYSPNDHGYDRERALFGEDVLGWLGDTQPEQLAKVLTSPRPRGRGFLVPHRCLGSGSCCYRRRRCGQAGSRRATLSVQSVAFPSCFDPRH
ncbi:MAG: hypothetical protein K0U78_18470 [Actinomycetia bacterium]|nr:hypothetical protein [Actinomycetes bacterium]